MRLKITHRTEYRYDAPVHYLLQRLQAAAVSGSTQTVLSWALAIEGAREEVRFVDHFGNDTRLLSVEGERDFITRGSGRRGGDARHAGVSGPAPGFTPLWLFQSETPLTAVGAVFASSPHRRQGRRHRKAAPADGTIGERVA